MSSLYVRLGADSFYSLTSTEIVSGQILMLGGFFVYVFNVVLNTSVIREASGRHAQRST